MAHSWPAQSPEANHTVLVSGSGSSSTLAHAQELSAQAAQLQALVSASQVNAAGTYGSAWSGAGATGSQNAQAGVNAALGALAGWLEVRVPVVTAAAQAYHSAVSAMVPTHEAQANRAQEADDVEINPRVLGALTPQITELNLDYFGYMWPTNASAGTSYGAALNAATAALDTPPPPATPAAAPEAPATTAAAVADAEGRTVAGAGMRQAHQSVQAASAVTQHGSGMSQAMVPPPTPTPAVPPTKFAELRPPVPSTPAAPPPVGMYQQPPSNAAVYGPPAPAAAPGTPAGMRPSTPGAPVNPPTGLTSFVRPPEPFAMPAASSVQPGILNAASVYAAATAAPISAVPLQHLEPPPLQPPPTTAINALNPPPAPAPPTTPDPAGPPASSAQPSLGPPPPGPPPPPRPDQGAVQMFGQGPPAPQSPPFPIPAQPAPAPPPPPPGEPPLKPAPIPSWVTPLPSESEVQAQEQYKEVIKKIQAHNSRWPNRTNPADVALYNSEANYLNNWKAQLEGQLEGWNAEYTRESISPRQGDITSGWTQPAPEAPEPNGPAYEPPVPQNIEDTLGQIDSGKWPNAANAPGTKGGSAYFNRDQNLPTMGDFGKPITYQEWDANPKIPNQDRGLERIITGSDGSAWYTIDHYRTFHRIR